MISKTAIETFAKRKALPMIKKTAIHFGPTIADNFMNGNISDSLKSLREEKKAGKETYIEELKAEIAHQRIIETSAELFEERQAAAIRKLELIKEQKELTCGHKRKLLTRKVH